MLMMMMKNKLRSRKLWVAVLSAAAVALGRELGLSEATAMQIAGIAAAYILGQGVADHGSQGL